MAARKKAKPLKVELPPGRAKDPDDPVGFRGLGLDDPVGFRGLGL